MNERNMKALVLGIVSICLTGPRCFGGCQPSCGVLNWSGEWLVPPAYPPPCVVVVQPPCVPCAGARPSGRAPVVPVPRENGYSKESSGTARRHRTHTQHPNVSVSAVRSNDIVKVYDIGRYVDPVDCRVMHERHAVYRLESASGWKLQPPVGQNEILLGPIVGLRRAEYHPEPVAGELGQQIQQTRRDAEVAASTTEVLKSQLEALQQRMNDDAARQNQNNAMIADQIRQLREELSKRQAAPTGSPSPSPASTTM
jgi:hypothetical protein